MPGSSSTDFWGIAHVPSQIEREVLSAADLERRLDLLRACWAYFDDIAARVSRELRPGSRGGGRSRDQIIRHVYCNEPEQFSRKVEVRTPRRRRPHPGRPRDGIARRTSMPSAPTTPRASRRGPGRSSSSCAAPPTTSWIMPGRWRTGTSSGWYCARTTGSPRGSRRPRARRTRRRRARRCCRWRSRAGALARSR